MTGARVLHGPSPADEIVFADTAREGDAFEIGKLRISVLETPGHTDDGSGANSGAFAKIATEPYNPLTFP